jgi:hypothetical protein
VDAADFLPLLGGRFRVDRAGAVIFLELAEVRPSPPGSPAEARHRAAAGIREEPFSLLFRGPRDTPLDQRIHRLEHERLGTLEIFLVPVRPDDRGPLYEAVFN